MPRILLGVCGGIAAYKALEFSRLALKAGHSVRVVQTEASTRFIGQASFAAITGAPVLVSEWEPDPLRGAFPGDPLPEHAPLSHLALVERADAYLIAPATAQTLAKLAGGHADNLLTAAALACRRPLIVAPAMNNAMYEHPATQANLATLRERGVTVLEPGTGALGSPGEFGIGRLPEPPELLEAIEAALAADRSLDGLAGLVTPGGPGGSRPPRRPAGADRRRALRRQPLLRADGARARRGGQAAGRQGDGRRGHGAAPPARRDRIPRRADRRGARRRLRRALRGLRRAADGRRRGRLPAGRPACRQAPEGRDRRGTQARVAPYRGCARRPRRPPPPRPADRRLRRRARRRGAGVRAREAGAQGPGRDRRQRHRGRGRRLRVRRQRGLGRDARRGAPRGE